MKNSNIKYVVGLLKTNKTLANISLGDKIFKTPFGEMVIQSEDDYEYVDRDMLLDIKFFNTRQEARDNPNEYGTEEHVYQVVVKNNKIISWLKKNP